jgi:hypothetical protein
MLNIMKDAKAHGLSSDWKVRLSAIVWFILFVLFLLSVPILLDWSLWVVLGVIAVSAVLGLGLTWLWHRFVHRSKPFGKSYLKATLLLSFLLTILLAAPIYFLALQTALSPAVVPQVTLTNGKKTVVFQGMQHIGSDPFYKGIIYDLEKALTENYVLYYEGVANSTPEGDAWFSKKLAGGGDLSESYKALSKTCGLVFQLDYFTLLTEDMLTHPERHITADVTTLQMKQEYDRLMATDPEFARRNKDADKSEAKDSDEGDGLKSILNVLTKGTPGQKALGGTVCRGLISMSMSHSAKTADDSPLEPVVLDYRNKMLAERILGDTHSKIYVTYGAAHIPGVITILRKNDPAWHVVSEKWVRTIEAPDEQKGYGTFRNL